MKFKRALILCVMGLAISVMAGPFNFPTSGSSGSDISASSVNDLNDVDASTATAGNVMTLRGDGQWVGATVAGTGDVVAASDNAFSGNNTMSGPLTLVGTSSMTIRGPAFSVGVSTFVVKEGKVGIGTTAPAYDLDIAAGTMRIRKASPSVNFLTFDSNLGAGPSASPIISFERQGVQYASMTVSDVGNVGFSFFGGKTRIVSNGMIFESDGNLLAARGSLDILGYGTNSYALSVSTAFNTYDFVVTTTNKVGVGTSNPSYKFHSVSDAATSGTVFAVSTGTVDLFAVHGTSVSLEVPLVWPDGTVQVTAPSVSGAADNLGNHVATTTLNMASNPILGITSGTFSGDVTVYGQIKGGSGNAVLASTPSIKLIANTGNYDFYLSSFTIPGSIGTSSNPNLLLFGSTVTTFSTPVVSTGSISAKNISTDPVLFEIDMSSDTLAAGCTIWLGNAPSYTSVTITKVIAVTYSVAASSANYSLQEKTVQSANGSQIFNGTYSTGTWNHQNPITSFADASIAAGSGLYFVTKDGGSIAGAPRHLSVKVYGKYDIP